MKGIEQIFQWDENDSLGQLINQQIYEWDNQERNDWIPIFILASKATQGRPSRKYLDNARILISDIGQEIFTKQLRKWIDFAIELKNTQIAVNYDFGYENHVHQMLSFLTRKNIILLKGLIWMTSLLEENLLIEVKNLAIRSFKKIPKIGCASTAIGNACLYVLGNVEGTSGMSFLMELNGLKLNAKAKIVVNNYLQKASERVGIPLSKLKEMSVPDFGLVNGRLDVSFDDFTLEIEILGIGKSKLTWIKPDGSIQKSVPAFIQKDVHHIHKWKHYKEINVQLRKQLTTQKNLLDRGYILNRSWDYKHFETYFLDHGLVGFLTKRLIWRFQLGTKSVVGINRYGQWVDLEGQEINWIDDQTTVTLWHPVEDTVEHVLAWRNYIMEWEILQPMKQAFREIYLLTDAERNTNTYSNRMAAHILKQNQFSALTRIRNWKYSIMGDFNRMADGLTKLDIADHQMKVEFWVNELEDDADSWIRTYISTDQVRFFDANNQTLELRWIPEIVFSEVMRDVDLFVGVCSVGNDHEWSDNEGKPQMRDYWRTYSFGDLSEVAKTRKSVLERLIPRLKIRDVAHLNGNFLVVKGQKRTYKIHIGSGNILMEPNDQYLCIVPDKKSKINTNKFYLPFEGDKGMSIVLSKAFLLAEDELITDKTILSQIS